MTPFLHNPNLPRFMVLYLTRRCNPLDEYVHKVIVEDESQCLSTDNRSWDKFFSSRAGEQDEVLGNLKDEFLSFAKMSDSDNDTALQ